jgi:hypothetical protein
VTPTERARELEISIQTRLGELCGNRKPTPEQMKMATDEAERHVEACETAEWAGRQK